MADIGIYTKNADIVALAGVNAGLSGASVVETDKYVLNVEAMINVDCEYDWSAAWTAGLSGTSFVPLLVQAGASKCAMNVVNADLTGMSSREAETILDYLNTMYDESMKILRDKDKQAFIIDG